jgi:hypothetical protein
LVAVVLVLSASTTAKMGRQPLNLSSREVVTFLDCFTVNEGWVPHCPDFLWRLAALIHSMRLSLMKGAHADLSSTAWQEIGVKPGFGLSGIPQHSTRLFCHPEPDPDFLPRIAGHSRVCCFLYGKQQEARQRHQAQQEIRGSGSAVRLSIKQLRSL